MDRQEIGQFIQAQRKEKKLTQRQLAQKCNLSRDTILNVENGNVNITIDALLTILNALFATIQLKPDSLVVYDIETVKDKVFVVNSKEPDTVYIYDFKQVPLPEPEIIKPEKNKRAKTTKYYWE